MQGNADESILSASRVALVSLSALVLAAAAFAFLASAASAKSIDTYFATHAGDIAVNEITQDVYVVQESLRRVVRLGPDGEPERIWGKDVIENGPGSTGYEICVVGVNPCKEGAEGQAKGEFIGSSPDGIAVDQSDGSVYVWDTRRSNDAAAENLRIQKFDADGNFVLMFGKGVNVTTGGDRCTEASGDICGPGLDTNAPGGFGNPSVNQPSLAVSPIDGDVFVADPLNRRLQRFKSDGTFVGVIGSSANFGTQQPRHVAVDSQGIVYASDGNSSGQIDRYDAYGAHGAPAFLSSIASPPLLVGGTGATVGLEIELDPESDGSPGSSTDHLYVLRDPNSGDTVVQQFDSPGEPSAPVAAASNHGSGAGFSAVGGLGANTVTGDLYVGTSNTVDGKIWILTDGADGIPSAQVALGPVTGITSRQAELTGNVDSNGEQTTYRFEYAVGGGPFTPVPGGVSSGDGEQPVSALLTGLTPNTPYRARLRAEKPVSPANTAVVHSNEGFFFTGAEPPEATTLDPHAYTDTSAWLAGAVNPNGTSTTYRFQWGRSLPYSNQVPLSPAALGDGATARSVLQQITGLKPETTYHYRVVAESSEGIAVGEDRTFTTRPAFDGFPSRAYEQVSPIEKNGYDIQGHEQSPMRSVAATLDGADPWVAFGSRGTFADANYGGGVDTTIYYVSHRSETGWSTRSMRSRPSMFGGGNSLSGMLSVDGWTTVVPSSFSLLPGAPPIQNRGGIYHHDLRAGLVTAIAEGPNLTAGAVVNGERAATPGLDRIAFTTSEVLTADPGVPVAANKVYEWRDGGLRLVSIDTSGVPFSTSAGLSGNSARNAISDDGRHIFFSSPASGSAEIYRRTDGVETISVSASVATVPDPLGPRAKSFHFATPDGNRVFFTSSEHLTDDANSGPSRSGADLYRYEVASDTLINLTAETNTAEGARVAGLLGVSDDGNRVYYVARGLPISGEGVEGAPNLYMWEADGTPNGHTRFIATLAASDEASYSSNLADLAARVTPSGRVAVFESKAPITGYGSGQYSQVYVYEADANDGAGALTCTSCRPNGSSPQGDSVVPRSVSGAENGPSQIVTHDGYTIYFESDDALIPSDTNGVGDVYEWRQGHLRLLSTGASASASHFAGAGMDGRDVFFVTREQLVGQDTDELRDVYDARVGAGLPSQSPPPPGEPCVGAACKPPPSSPPVSAPLDSSGVRPSDNVRSPRRQGKKRCKPRRRGKSRAAQRAFSQRAKRCVKRQIPRGDRKGKGRRGHQ